ncbi:MAG: threonine/serine dehydratase [Candidatus Bathyarchaeota archaeon]|nr:threonine/serine dehydratase [Candidatus Bathyarchaeota archaeon]
MEAPTVKDIVAARIRIRPHLLETPLHTYPALNKLLGAKAYIKHENYQPTGAFKIRGGINLVSQLTEDERSRGIITASTGNHGQSIALAAKLYGVKATVCVQKGANPDKVAAIQSHGATIIEQGTDFDEARLNAESLAKKHGYRYIHSANEPHLIAGVGTMAMEMIERQIDLDAVIAPVGAGTCACGCAIAYKAISPETRIIAVQTQSLPAVRNSWISGNLESTPPAKTIADGLATRQAFELPVQILRRLADDFTLVEEIEIRAAIKLYAEKAHTIAEGAGAAPLAAAVKLRDQLRGKKIGLILSGGNITADNLRDIINQSY